jgi:alpha-beta hydrolase superfamily lysophospholipase
MSQTETISSSAGTRFAAADMGAARLPSPIAPHLEHDRIIARDGAVLPLRSWLPDGAPRAVVLALHGFNDYSNAFADTGPTFAAGGVAVFAYDQRGFGAAPLRGRWAGTDRLVDDALTATGLLRERYPGVPVYLLGESMGGAVAILASVRSGRSAAPPDGVVLLAPAVWGRSTMNVFERAGLWLADFMPQVRWSPDLIPVRIRASDNIPMLRALGADPLVIRDTRADALNGLVDLMSAALDAAPRFRARALILYGERDEIVPRLPVLRFVGALPPSAAARQRLALYPQGYHLLSRDLDGPLVVGDMLSWIERQDAPLPSGADIEGRARLAGRPNTTPTAAAGARPSWQRAPS